MTLTHNLYIEAPPIVHFAWTAAIPLITAGLSGLSGLFGGKPKVNTTTSDTTSSSTGTQSGQSTTNLSPSQQNLIDYFTNDAINRYNKGPMDLKGFEAGGLENINQGADLKKKIIDNTLASKGLSFSPASVFPQVQNESDRVNQGVNFENTIPQVQRMFQDQDFGNLLKSFGILPNAGTSFSGTSTQNSTSSTKGTQTSPSNQMGGLFSGLGSILPFFGLGGGGNNQPGGAGSGGFYGGTGN